MNLSNETHVVIDGNVVAVKTRGGDSRIFMAGSSLYCATSGRELDLNFKPFGPQLAFPIESTDDLGMDGAHWMASGKHKVAR